MVRVVKNHAVRRNEILDVAQRLMVTSGYEQMTIQDILDELGISKGAFYHYFSSKQGLLEAIIARMLDEADKLLAPILNDSTLPALEKFERFFTSVSDWKTAQKSFVLALLKVWYQDDNAIVRQKLRLTMVQHISPLIATIIRQGNQESVMVTSDPDQAGEVALQLIYDLSDTIGLLLVAHQLGSDSLERMAGKIAAYTEAIERVLGASPGSLFLVDMEVMRQWAESIEPVQPMPVADSLHV
jgi:AcrR family transcriptional regulator